MDRYIPHRPMRDNRTGDARTLSQGHRAEESHNMQVPLEAHLASEAGVRGKAPVACSALDQVHVALITN